MRIGIRSRMQVREEVPDVRVGADQLRDDARQLVRKDLRLPLYAVDQRHIANVTIRQAIDGGYWLTEVLSQGKTTKPLGLSTEPIEIKGPVLAYGQVGPSGENERIFMYFDMSTGLVASSQFVASFRYVGAHMLFPKTDETNNGHSYRSYSRGGIEWMQVSYGGSHPVRNVTISSPVVNGSVSQTVTNSDEFGTVVHEHLGFVNLQSGEITPENRPLVLRDAAETFESLLRRGRT